MIKKRSIKGRLRTLVSKLDELEDIARDNNIDLPPSFSTFYQELIQFYMDEEGGR